MEFLTLTEDEIRGYRDLFPTRVAENVLRSSFTFLVANEGKTSAGLCFVTREMQEEGAEKTAWILHFASGDKKAADALLTEYEKILKKQGIKRSIFSLPGELKLSDAEREALSKKGYKVTVKETDNLTVTAGKLRLVEQLKIQDPPKNIRPLKDFSSRMIRRGLGSCLTLDERAHYEDLQELPVEWFDPELSCCMEASGKLVGFFLIHKMADAEFRAELLTSTKEAGKNGLLQMLRFSANRFCDRYPEEAMVHLIGRDEATKKLMTYFFPGEAGDTVLYAEKKG